MRNEMESAEVSTGSRERSPFFSKDGGRKKTLIIVLAVILLAGIGWFVWDYFGAEEQGEKTDQGIITEVVDQDGWVGIDAQIAVDSQNNPYISSYDQGNRDLKYARRMNNSWQNETVDSQGDVGEESGIAVDKDNNPHISYIDVTKGAVKYAKKINGEWKIEFVEQKDGYHSQATSIALDSNGYPHIVYNWQPSDDNGDEMTDDNLDGDADNNLDDNVKAAIDDNDDKVDNGNDKLDNNKGNAVESHVKYASWNGKSWDIEIVTGSGSDVYLTLDKNNVPHLSFKKEDPDVMNKDSEKINHATKKDGQWKVEIVDKEVQAGGDTGIAVDSKGNPHIAYHDYANKAKKYAYWDGSSWQTKIVVQDGVNNEGLKIAIDKNDKPQIVYTYGKKETLMLAILDNDSWSTKTIDKMGNPGIAIDSLNQTHLSYGHTAEDKENRFVEIRKQTGEKEIEILKYALVK